MMRDCDLKRQRCRCIDWESEDMFTQLDFLMNNFEPRSFRLEYHTLEPETNRRLCKTGRCRICGGQLCYGTELSSQNAMGDLLTEIYQWMHQPHLTKGSRETFLALFHESDQDFVREWLSRTEDTQI